MSVYAISDIHGCYDEFIYVLDKCAFSSDDELYILGDAIDRGPASDKVIKWLVDNKANAADSNIHFVKGNHEQMMIWSMDGDWRDLCIDYENGSMWKPNGGLQTLTQLSSALSSGFISPEDMDYYQEMLFNAPVMATANTQTGESVLMCHAGIRPPDDPDNVPGWLTQAEDDLLWYNGWYSSYKYPPFHVVSGHIPTSVLSQWDLYGCPQEEYINGMLDCIMQWGQRHAIDCGSCFGGRVGALRIDDWQTFTSPQTAK